MSWIREPTPCGGRSMQRSRIYLTIFSLTIAAGCHSQSSSLGSVLDGRIGTYHFAERVPSTQGSEMIAFEGQFTVLGDTVMIDATPGPCRYDRRASNATELRYQCGDVGVVFDRLNPVEKATYSVAVVVSDNQRNCGTGKRCAATTPTTPTDRTEVKTGRLRATPVR